MLKSSILLSTAALALIGLASAKHDDMFLNEDYESGLINV